MLMWVGVKEMMLVGGGEGNNANVGGGEGNDANGWG